MLKVSICGVIVIYRCVFADICSGCYVCEAAVDSGIMHDSEGYLMEQLYNGKTAS